MMIFWYLLAFVVAAALTPFIGPWGAIAVIVWFFVWKSCGDLLRLLDKLDAQERESKPQRYGSD